MRIRRRGVLESLYHTPPIPSHIPDNRFPTTVCKVHADLTVIIAYWSTHGTRAPSPPTKVVSGTRKNRLRTRLPRQEGPRVWIHGYRALITSITTYI